MDDKTKVKGLPADPDWARVVKPKWVKYATIVLGLIFFELLAYSNLTTNITLLPLSEIIILLVKELAAGTFTPHIFQTGSAIFAGFSLALVTAFPVAIVLWWYEILGEIADPFLLSLYAVPLYIFYPLLIILFGLNIIPVVIIAWLMSSIAIVENVRSGLSDVPEVYPKVGKAMGLGWLKSFIYIYLPAATPQIFTGLKLGFIYALIGTIASEFILADKGLGFLVAYSYNQFSTARMYAAMALVILIAVVVNRTLLQIEHHLEQWREV